MAEERSRAVLAKGPGVLALLVVVALVQVAFFDDMIPQAMSAVGGAPDPLRACLVTRDDFQVWKEYELCVAAHTKGPHGFRDRLREEWEDQASAFPWTRHPGGSAILVEFRPLEKQLRWSVQNALDNLPVSWPIHVAGSAAVLNVVREAFPVETLIRKVRLVDLMKNDMSQVMPRIAERMSFKVTM